MLLGWCSECQPSIHAICVSSMNIHAMSSSTYYFLFAFHTQPTAQKWRKTLCSAILLRHLLCHTTRTTPTKDSCIHRLMYVPPQTGTQAPAHPTPTSTHFKLAAFKSSAFGLLDSTSTVEHVLITQSSMSCIATKYYLLANLRAPSCTSLPSSSPPHFVLACLAASTLLSHADRSKSGQDWKGHRCLNRPGAVLVAIKAASIRKVPEPHMGSASTPASMLVLLFLLFVLCL